ncbi:MAG: hypothetical protein LQ351_004395 [Letrouitia transgressa]|nr:MAG: hypothetical protein LQ351_004395 [Letrouitia transgressa]
MASCVAPPSAPQPYYHQLPAAESQPEELAIPQQSPQTPAPQTSSPNPRKRKASESDMMTEVPPIPTQSLQSAIGYEEPRDYRVQQSEPQPTQTILSAPAPKKSRTNTPWSPAEEQRLKTMRDAGNSWSEIAKTFPNRTEGSVKKHWYKQDMHYADFAEDESAALFAAIKEYEASKWKVIGQKVGKPAKACEQYAKEHFRGQI